jgi:hypothetical protein
VAEAPSGAEGRGYGRGRPAAAASRPQSRCLAAAPRPTTLYSAQQGQPLAGMQPLRTLLAVAIIAAAATVVATSSRQPQPPEDDCGLKMRELCHGTTGAECLACAGKGAAVLREAGCTGARERGLCLQTRVHIVAGPFGSVATDTALASVRTGACPTDGHGDQACSLRELTRGDDEFEPPSLCMESSAVPRDNYFVTASGMVVDNVTRTVFPLTQLLQLRSLVDDVQFTTVLHLAHFQNYNESGPGGNLSNVALDINAPGRQMQDGDTASLGIWSITHMGSCEVAVPDPTYSCDRESVQCKKDAWPIPGGERNRSACMEGCTRVEPCSEGFVYENITDVWRNIKNRGDGPPDPDGRGCSRGFCYGTDQLDSDVLSRCSKTTSAGTGVGGGKWYRFVGEDNTGMATAPVSNDHCGTAWGGWLSGWGDINTKGLPPRGYDEPGRYPDLGEGIVDGTACFTKSCGVSGDTRPLPIATVRCADPAGGTDYLLWKLEYTSCASAYCTDRHSKRESPCKSGLYTTLEDEWRSVEHTGRAEMPDGSLKVMTDLDLDKRCPTYGTEPSGVGDNRWYRFIGKGGTALPSKYTENVTYMHCGTQNPGWLSGWNASADAGPGAKTPPASYAEPGRYPAAGEGVVEMTVCFDGKGFETPPQRDPCFASKQIGVVQCPEGGPLLWRLPFAPDIWGPSGDCTFGYCTDPNTAEQNPLGGYGGRGLHVPQQ